MDFGPVPGGRIKAFATSQEGRLHVASKLVAEALILPVAQILSCRLIYNHWDPMPSG